MSKALYTVNYAKVGSDWVITGLFGAPEVGSGAGSGPSTHFRCVRKSKQIHTSGFVVLPIKIGGWSSRVKAWVLETEYDLILGRDFLRAENPRIDWRTSVMNLTDHSHRTYAIYPTSNSRMITQGDAHANLISARHFSRIMRKNNAKPSFS